MNKKFLFGMLVSGAMLAACTADDLNTAPVAKDVNPSAPVFTVSLETGDLQNRAEYVTEENGKPAEKIRFEAKKDLLSLYHGVGDFSSFTGYNNAIYQGNTPESGEEGVLEFTTKSMVYAGYAVMVYPADTTFNWFKQASSGAPYIQVPAEQSRKTNEMTPYMSEILKIAEYNDIKTPGNEELNQDEMAGYGRKYDIVLKRAASLLKMNLIYTKPELEGVEDELTIIGVKLDNTKTGDNEFTLQIPVTVGEADVHENAEEDEDGKVAHPIWAKSSALDATKIGETTPVISTSDIENNVARLTLLPVKENFKFTDGKIVIETNYGNITLKADDVLMENPFYNEDGNEEAATEAGWPFGATDKELKVAQVIEKIMTYVSHEKAGEGRRFEGEYEGASRTLPVAFDATELDLDGVHVKDDATLSTLLKVYRALNKGKLAEGKEPSTVTLVLDGETEGDNAKKFVMSPETNQLLAEVTKDFTVTKGNQTTKYFQFALCAKKGEECTAIQLKNETSSTATIYDLAGFWGSYRVDGVNTTGTRQYNIELFGKWTFANNVDDDGAVIPTVLRRAETFTILEEGTLELGNLTVDVDNQAETGTTPVYFAMVNKGTVNVTAKVRFSENLENFGTINITRTSATLFGDLIIQGNKKLTNREAEFGEDGETPATGWDWDKGGVINNEGVLEIFQNNETNIIENFGLLNINHENAVTLITRNGDKEAAINVEYNKTHRMGTIFLTVENAGAGSTTIKDANVSGTTVADATKKQGVVGFVKYYSGDTQGNKFKNYMIIDAKHPAKNGTLTNEIYAEVNDGTYTVTSKPTYAGLVIGEGVTIQINDGAELNATDYLLHNGYIRIIGKLTGLDKTTGYYGSDGKGEVFSDNGGNNE